jgi:hypothetical protein
METPASDVEDRREVCEIVLDSFEYSHLCEPGDEWPTFRGLTNGLTYFHVGRRA